MKNLYPRLGALATLVTLGILALTAGLFFILPRTAEAAFSRLVAHGVFLPGFSNQVSLGDIGEIKTSSRPMMHVRVWSAQPVGPMKWRGAALSDFDGKRWTNPRRRQEQILVENDHVILSPSELRPPGRRVNYHVELEAMENDTLFFAGTPEALDLKARAIYRSENAGYRLGGSVRQGFRYDVWSLLDDPPERSHPLYPPPVLPLSAREAYLQLPALDRRIAALARAWASGGGDDLSRARALERHLRTDFSYTLQLPEREVADPLAHFLFVRRKGHCEYFASSMAVMLRTVGIPSRMATGFQSGIYNPVNDLWLIRASDAHSWVEGWIPGYGWTTFDPTPADPNAGSLGLLSRITLYLDAAETFWQEWVVTYDLARQGSLAYRMEQTAHRAGLRWVDTAAAFKTNWDRYAAAWSHRYGWQPLAWAVVLFAVGMSAGPLYRLLRIRRRVELVRRGQGSVADATLLYLRMLQILRQRGYQKPPWFTPTEFAASLPRSPLGESVGEFTHTYNALRFGGHAGAASKLSVLLDRMERE